MEGFEWSADNADIADTLQLRDIAMATTFWLPTGYNFDCVIASDTLLNSRGAGFRGQAIQVKSSQV